MMQPTRRATLLAPMLGATLARPAAAAPAPIRFRIMRERSAIGSHRVTFSDEAGRLQARTDVEVVVRLAGITVFRLTHQFEEVWEGERVMRVSSRLERNGRVTAFTGRAEPTGLRIEDAAGFRLLPAAAAPLTWWDPRRFERPLFANDTARILRLEWRRAPRPGGAVRWSCTGDEQGEGTYAADDRWLDWETKGEDGSQVTYVRE